MHNKKYKDLLVAHHLGAGTQVEVTTRINSIKPVLKLEIGGQGAALRASATIVHGN